MGNQEWLIGVIKVQELSIMYKIREWEQLPDYMKQEALKPYYNLLRKKRVSLLIKRCFDVAMSFMMLLLLSPVFLVLAVWIKSDSKGPVFFRQVRVTQYGRLFKIIKFRTMVNDAESKGAQVTSKNDARITRVGEKIRKYRLDEFPQLINVLFGDMSFVGTRPEVPKYVKRYDDEMYATLLLPAGITSEASIRYKDEDELLSQYADIMSSDSIYIKKILPEKMKWNLKAIKEFSLWNEIKVMINTVIRV